MADAPARRALALAAALGGPLLGLDTSTATTSLCLAVPGAAALLESHLSAASLPSEALVEGLAELLRSGNVAPKDLRAAVVGIGPGSFTGLRVGLATIKGLALGTSLPVFSVSSLAVMAASAGPGYVAPFLDARRGEWYTALYEVPADGAAARALLEDSILTPEAATQALRQRLLVGATLRLSGDVAAAAQALLRDVAVTAVPTQVRMAHGIVLAEAALRRGAAEPLATLVPRYMRVSEAERQLEQRISNA